MRVYILILRLREIAIKSHFSVKQVKMDSKVNGVSESVNIY